MSNLENSTNFLNKFRDSESRQITRLSAHQFMQVWEHYDEDGKLKKFTLMSLPRTVSWDFWHLRSVSFSNTAYRKLRSLSFRKLSGKCLLLQPYQTKTFWNFLYRLYSSIKFTPKISQHLSFKKLRSKSVLVKTSLFNNKNLLTFRLAQEHVHKVI